MAHAIVVCNSCIFRTPVRAGGDVYLPACFPLESLQSDSKSTPLALSDEDMGEVSLQIPFSILAHPHIVLQLHSLLVYASCFFSIH